MHHHAINQQVAELKLKYNYQPPNLSGSGSIFTIHRMITRKEYLSKTDTQWRGVQVRTRVDIRNGNIKIPKGTILIIAGKSSGFRLEGPVCSCCGIGPYITRVEPHCVELVETQPAPATEPGNTTR